MKQNLDKVVKIVESYDCEPHNLIAIMQEIQTEFNYLSEAALTKVAEMLEIPISRVYSVATFYENFSLEPKGKYIIREIETLEGFVRTDETIVVEINEKYVIPEEMFTLINYPEIKTGVTLTSPLLWVGIGVLAIALAGGSFLVVSRKRKAK